MTHVYPYSLPFLGQREATDGRKTYPDQQASSSTPMWYYDSRPEYPEPDRDYSQVYIEPQYSEIESRKKVSTSFTIESLDGSLKLKVPVVSANMDTITGPDMAIAMYKAGAIVALHRGNTTAQAVADYKQVVAAKADAFVSVGVIDFENRAEQLYDAGARFFIIDVAHGHHKLVKDTLAFFNKKMPFAFVVAGNIATGKAALDLMDWGAKGVKVGIGPGSVCTTKDVTGVTRPQWSAVKDVAETLERLFEDAHYDYKPLVIADGGFKNSGDIAKALGAGADLAMSGSLFTQCAEVPSPGTYRGMASQDAMNARGGSKGTTPEGIAVSVLGPQSTTAKDVVQSIQGGLRSAFSYSNAKNLKQFQQRCIFGYKA